MTNLLVIDVGNTSISYGLVKSGRLSHYFNAFAHDIPKIDYYLTRSGLINKIDKVIISSVNPKNMQKVKNWLKNKISPKNLLIISQHLKPKITHKYQNVGKLGKDRLVNIYGAIRRYQTPLLMINFGTATTVDYISKKGVYEGGLIIPGIETSWNALQERAALLPKMPKIQDYPYLIGRNTENCMRAGLLQGFGAMVDGLIGRFKTQYGSSLFVLASGGLAKKIQPYVMSKIKVDQMHHLKSLALIYKNHTGEK